MDELKKLYDYLDSFSFVWVFEVNWAVQDYFSDNWEKQLSYWEVNLCQFIAEKYISERWLEFEDDENI